MSTIKNWFEDLQHIASTIVFNFDVTKFSAVKVSSHTEQLTLAQVQKKLDQFGAITGWIQETSHVHTINNQPVQLQSTILNGEWVADDHSYSLDYIGRDVWSLQQYYIQACDVLEATHLSEIVLQRGVGVTNQSSLRYQRLWKPDEKNNYAPVARIAVFSGFEE